MHTGFSFINVFADYFGISHHEPQSHLLTRSSRSALSCSFVSSHLKEEDKKKEEVEEDEEGEEDEEEASEAEGFRAPPQQPSPATTPSAVQVSGT